LELVGNHEKKVKVLPVKQEGVNTEEKSFMGQKKGSFPSRFFLSGFLVQLAGSYRHQFKGNNTLPVFHFSLLFNRTFNVARFDVLNNVYTIKRIGII